MVLGNQFALPAKAQGCPGKTQGQFGRARYTEFCSQKPRAWACPGHPRLEAATISARKTWVARPSPGTGILLGCAEIIALQPISIPAKAGTQEQATEIPGFPLSRE